MKARAAWSTVPLALAALASALWAQDAPPRRGFSIRISEPPDQELVLGKARIAAEVSIADPAQIDRVEFLIDDAVIFVDREPPFECRYDFGEASRSWIVRVVAYHKEGVAVSDTVVTRKIPFFTRERVNRVLVWFSATDEAGGFVTTLSPGDFRVSENDAPQALLEFYREDRPITLAILIDTSGSMKDKLAEVHKAAGAFVDNLQGEDRALVIDFDDRVFLIQDLTSDHAQLKAAITSTESIGGTAIFDALHAAYRRIGAIEGRKAIILLSDGEDTASQLSFKRVLAEAKAGEAILYGIAMSGGDRSVLKELSAATGGRFFAVQRAADLSEVYQNIAEELRAQFYLTYSSPNETWDGRFMRVRVEHADPQLSLRARPGYFAVRGRGPSRNAGAGSTPP